MQHIKCSSRLLFFDLPRTSSHILMYTSEYMHTTWIIINFIVFLTFSPNKINLSFKFTRRIDRDKSDPVLLAPWRQVCLGKINRQPLSGLYQWPQWLANRFILPLRMAVPYRFVSFVHTMLPISHDWKKITVNLFNMTFIFGNLWHSFVDMRQIWMWFIGIHIHVEKEKYPICRN